ncbi:MAG: TetR family transcriptional regulator [Chloroflexi bacterium]|nr:MAG: TetR family transcriptional regulator [Chloroflexota bacterium]
MATEDTSAVRRQETETSALNREAVIQAALEMLDTVGIDGLSMRALAEHLGVKAASLYWHLRDKEQLLEMVAETLLDRVEVPTSPVGWRPQVAATCESLAQLLRDHRAGAGVVLGNLLAVQRSRLTHELTRTLRLAGLEDAEGASFALVVEAAASASTSPAATLLPRPGEVMTLAIDSGSWRVMVRPAPPGTVDVATSAGGGGAPSIDVRPGGLVVVHNRRGGNRGAVELSPDYTWYIKVHGGTWNTVLDLSGLRLSGIEMDSGSGNITCTLPAPAGAVPIRVNSGIVNVTFHRPRNTAVHAAVSSGSVKVRLDDRTIKAMASDVHWDTPGALRSDDRYDVTVYSGCVRVTMDASAPAVPRPPRPDAPHEGGEPLPRRTDQGVNLILDGIEKRLSDLQIKGGLPAST